MILKVTKCSLGEMLMVPSSRTVRQLSRPTLSCSQMAPASFVHLSSLRHLHQRMFSQASKRTVSATPLRLELHNVAKAEMVAKKSFKDANFPVDNEGRVYHLGVRRGEVANRVLSVGDNGRARLLAGLMDSAEEGGGGVAEMSSSRGFTVFTGRVLGVPVSIIGTGMGTPMMDFVVREARAVVEGDMAFIRLGTCGLVDECLPVGTIVAATKGSVFIRREPDAFHVPHATAEPAAHHSPDVIGPQVVTAPYRISNVVPACPHISAVLLRELLEAGGRVEAPVVEALNASADSFYSSQARTNATFDDRNEDLLDSLRMRHPEVVSLEMETFHLLDLARCSHGTIQATACAIGLAQRHSNEFLEAPRIKVLEKAAGMAVLRALALCNLKNDADGGCTDAALRVW